jgi:nucleotide-binding universal stress UspA family protein
LIFPFLFSKFIAPKTFKLNEMDNVFKKILIAFDGSDSSKSALQSAYGVAQKFNSELTALVVSEKDTKPDTAKSYLLDFAQSKRLHIEIIERNGAVYDEVVKLEMKYGYGLILIGSHGTNGWKVLFT